jgi:hypothetical protein
MTAEAERKRAVRIAHHDRSKYLHSTTLDDRLNHSSHLHDSCATHRTPTGDHVRGTAARGSRDNSVTPERRAGKKVIGRSMNLRCRRGWVDVMHVMRNNVGKERPAFQRL